MRPFPPAAESVRLWLGSNRKGSLRADGPLGTTISLYQAQQHDVAGRRVEQDAISGGITNRWTIHVSQLKLTEIRTGGGRLFLCAIFLSLRQRKKVATPLSAKTHSREEKNVSLKSNCNAGCKS